MPNYYFTFPQKDADRKDCFTVVEAPDEDAARHRIIGLYGRDGWAFCYRPHEVESAITKYDLVEIALGE